MQLFETGDAAPCCWRPAARNAWELSDTNKASSLQNPEQMALENEAPLRCIATPPPPPHHPPSDDRPHISLCSTPHPPSSTNEPILVPIALKVADAHVGSTPGKRQTKLLNMDNEVTETGSGGALGVICRDEFSFTWRSRQMAGSDLGSPRGATAVT